MRALHLFHTYLPQTQNWIYRLLIRIPHVQIIIGARHFIECRFYSDQFEYLQLPIRTSMQPVDLIHSHFGPVGWSNLAIAKQFRVPHIVSFYGYDYEKLPHTQPIWRERYTELFEQADIFICEGTHGADVLESLGCPRDKIDVVRLGVDVGSMPSLGAH